MMLDNSLIFYGGGLVVLVALLLLFARRERAGTALGVAGQIAKAAILARELVGAAEQLWLTGRLKRDERLDYVMDKLALYFPDLDRQQVYPLVEAAVYWLKLLKEQAPDDLPRLFDGGEADPVGESLNRGGRYVGTGGTQYTGGHHAGTGGA